MLVGIWRAHQGVGGAQDWSNALHTLYDVLLTLCKVMVSHCAAARQRVYLELVFKRIAWASFSAAGGESAQAPFTPFLTETMYQNLRRVGADTLEARSVHFLLFPKPNLSYRNDEVERRMARMQTVIDLGRVARERRTLPVKVRRLSGLTGPCHGVLLTDCRRLDAAVTAL